MISHDDYNKVSDVMLTLGDRGVMKMNVTLNYLAYEGKKVNYHSEVQSNQGFKINRKFQYYISFERTGPDRSLGVMIRTQDMILLQRKLNECMNWFEDKNQFMYKNNKLICLAGTKPVILDGLAANKYLQFEPIVVQFDESSAVSPGVRITLGDPEVYIDIEVSKFYSMKYLIDTTNLYIAAQGLLSYLGRPEFGTNLYIMDAYDKKNQEQQPKQSTIKGPISRTLRKNKSFFEVDE